jgi:transposase InsO family protein
VFILTILDDHSRFVLASRTFDKELTTADVILVVGEAIKQWGKPKQLLTDRGCQFHINSDDPSLFTLWLHGLDIQHIKARPRHPRTLGKIERWHRSLKEWLAPQAQPRNRAEMWGLLHKWVTHYNNERPHWALGNRVPLEAYIQGGFMSDEAVARLVNEVA